MNTLGYGKPGDANGPDRIQTRIDTPAKMKTCPFCGSTHWCDWHAGHRTHPWTTECMVCGASGPWADTEEEAKRLWNRRTSE